MSTLQRSLVPEDLYEIQIQTSCYDDIRDYHNRAAAILGAVLLLFGLLSIALGIGAICTLATGYFIGYGIWCGFIFSLTGIICMVSGCKPNACMIMASLVFCIMSICCGAVQFSIGVVSTDADAVDRRNNQMDFGPLHDQNAYDIFFTKNIYHHLCMGSDQYNWSSSWGPVDILLLLTGFIEFVIAIAVAALTCHSTCNGQRYAKGIDHNYTSGYQNQVYVHDERMSPQLVYKLGM